MRLALPLLAVCSANCAGRDAAGPATDGPARGEAAAAVDAVRLGTAGCGRDPGPLAAGRTRQRSLVAAGRERTAQIHLPTGYDPARPHALVLLFHGGLGTGMQMESSSRMSPIADREGFVVAYPDGLGRTWNAGGCCNPAAMMGIDDVGFVRALLDDLAAALCLDPRRVYAGGMSNGAMLSHRLGCELADRVAAIAPVAGTDMTAECRPARPVPVMQIHGSADQHVPWMGGDGCGVAGVPFTGVPETIARWQRRNGCTPGANTEVARQGDGRCELQGSCPSRGPVVLCTVDGGGHAWPGGGPRELVLPRCTAAGEGGQSTTFLASERMWSFFAAHPRE